VSWPLLALVGPSASGKSALALGLAERVPLEIVSCDSLQVYRGLDIGSAKASAEEQARVRHHLLDVVEPHEDFSAARWVALARQALAEIAGRGRLPVIVGGTGLYLKALLRSRLERFASRRGPRGLHDLLARIDAQAAARLHPNDLVRVVRALEVYRLTRRRLSDHLARPARGLVGFEVRVIGLAPGRPELRRRVGARTAAMFERGLVAETAGVLSRYGGQAPRPLRAIGYRQAVDCLAGRLDEATARERVNLETMQYAKRQMTWFRHQAQVEWHADGGPAAQAALGWLARAGFRLGPSSS
jgi:tRNA dimethylallyltransferase